MNRRDSLKIIGIATATATTGFIDACKPVVKPDRQATTDTTGRQPFEAERDKKLQEEKFFNSHEMATLAVLVDLIIQKMKGVGVQLMQRFLSS